VGLYRVDQGIFFAEWKDGKWVKYQDYTLAVNEKVLWFDAPVDRNVKQLSRYCMRYDFCAQDGRDNLPDWIETAAGIAGR
jgi:hypothetical protein